MASIVATPSKTKTWRAIVRLQGFPIVSRNFKIKSDAQDWAKQVEIAMRNGSYIHSNEASASTVSVKDAFDRYAKEILPLKRASTAKNERLRLAQLQNYFGQHSLAALTPTIIAQFRDMRLADGKSANTVRLDMALLSHLFTVAGREWGMAIARNPVQLVKYPSVKCAERTRRLLNSDELARLLSVCHNASNPQIGWIVEIALETGMRKSEILNLKLGDVNLDEEKLIITTTKGNPRFVPLTKRALALFRLAIDNPIRRNTGLIFFGSPGKDGNIKPFTIEKAFNLALLKANTVEFSFDCLRNYSMKRRVGLDTSPRLDVAETLGDAHPEDWAQIKALADRLAQSRNAEKVLTVQQPSC